MWLPSIRTCRWSVNKIQLIEQWWWGSGRGRVARLWRLKIFHNSSALSIIFCFSFRNTHLGRRPFTSFCLSYTTFKVNMCPSFLILSSLSVSSVNKWSCSISIFVLSTWLYWNQASVKKIFALRYSGTQKLKPVG